MYNHPERPTWPNFERRLKVEVLLRDLLTHLINAVLRRLPNGCQKIVLLISNGQLRADAKQRRDRHTLDKRPGVVVYAIFESGISFRVRRWKIVDLNGGAVGHDDPLPDYKRAALPERDDAVIGTDNF